MGRATVYCDACGSMIAPGDQDNGKARVAGDRWWCRDCAEKAPPDARPSGAKTGSTGTFHAVTAPIPSKPTGRTGAHRAVNPPGSPTRQHPSGMHRAVNPPGSPTRQHPSGSHKAVRPDSDVMRNLQSLQQPPAHHGPPPPAAQSGPPVALIVVVAVIAIGGLAFLFSGGKGDNGAAGAKSSAKDEDAAKAAFEKARAAKGAGTAAAWLELVREARKTASGTKYADDVEALFKEATAAAEQEEKEGAIRNAIADAVARAEKAQDPLSYLPLVEEARGRAAGIPALVGEADKAAATIRFHACRRKLEKIDPSAAASAGGRRKILEDLEAIRAESGGDAAVKALADRVQAAAEAEFAKASGPALEDLKKRVARLVADGRLDDAATEVAAFATDWAGSPAAAGAEDLRREIAAARDKLAGDWVAIGEKEWEVDAPGLQIQKNGREIAMTSTDPEDGVKDSSLKVGYALRDSSWKNFELELELKLDKVGCAVQLHPVAGGRPMSVRYMEKKTEEMVGLTPGRWYRMTVRVEGNQMTMGGDVQGGTNRINDGTGGFALVTFKGAKWSVRNARIRRLK